MKKYEKQRHQPNQKITVKYRDFLIEITLLEIEGCWDWTEDNGGWLEYWIAEYKDDTKAIIHKEMIHLEVDKYNKNTNYLDKLLGDIFTEEMQKQLWVDRSLNYANLRLRFKTISKQEADCFAVRKGGSTMKMYGGDAYYLDEGRKIISATGYTQNFAFNYSNENTHSPSKMPENAKYIILRTWCEFEDDDYTLFEIISD